MGAANGMYGHILVSGEDALATTIINELKSAGASVVKLCDRELASAAIADAAAVVCAGDDDATNLEIALLARKANPRVRVVARSEERRVGKECRSLCDWSSDVCSSDLNRRRCCGCLRR